MKLPKKVYLFNQVICSECYVLYDIKWIPNRISLLIIKRKDNYKIEIAKWVNGRRDVKSIQYFVNYEDTWSYCEEIMIKLSHKYKLKKIVNEV